MTREEQHAALDKVLTRRKGPAAAWEHNGRLVLEDSETYGYIGHSLNHSVCCLSWDWVWAFVGVVIGKFHWPMDDPTRQLFPKWKELNPTTGKGDIE